MVLIQKMAHQAGANAALLNIFLSIYVQNQHTNGRLQHTGSMARQRKYKTVSYTMGKTLANSR